MHGHFVTAVHMSPLAICSTLQIIGAEGLLSALEACGVDNARWVVLHSVCQGMCITFRGACVFAYCCWPLRRARALGYDRGVGRCWEQECLAGSEARVGRCHE